MPARRKTITFALILGIATTFLCLKLVVRDHALTLEPGFAAAKGGSGGNGNGGSSGGGRGNGGSRGGDNRGSHGGGGNGDSGNNSGSGRGENAKSGAGNKSGEDAGNVAAASRNANASVISPSAQLSQTYYPLRGPRHTRERQLRRQSTTRAEPATAGRRSAKTAASRQGASQSNNVGMRSSTKAAGRQHQVNRRAVVVSGLTDADIGRLSSQGLRVVSRSAATSSPVVKLALPRKVTPETARLIISKINSHAVADVDAIYRTDAGLGGCMDRTCAVAMIQWQASGTCSTPAVVGMIDTKIDLQHDALRGQNIEVVTLVPTPSSSSPDHGTAIAALLTGRAGSDAEGLLPQTRLVAVDAFGIENGEEQTDVVRIIAALEELARRNVRVVNLSFSGPPNEVLEQAIQRAQSRGMVLVAAVGNGGPSAGPSYPAGYPGVIAVTAVDREMRIYPRATRGDYVVLAAPGVGVPTAKAGGGEAVRSGTSFAVPFVTAAVARLIARQPTTNETQVAEALTSAARDIGKPGRDPEFGWGLLQTASLCEQPPNEPDRDVAGGSRRQASGERSLSRRDE
jgi:hypothetical protein